MGERRESQDDSEHDRPAGAASLSDEEISTHPEHLTRDSDDVAALQGGEVRGTVSTVQLDARGERRRQHPPRQGPRRAAG